jgi:fatty acid desaturase
MTSLAATPNDPTDDRTDEAGRPDGSPQPLSADAVRALSVRADRPGIRRAAAHLVLLGLGGTAIALAPSTPWLIAAMALHGVFIATLFGAMHEGVHYTAFRTRWLNQAVAWIAGAAILYNGDHYRVYHYAHHRYTQDPARDPELQRPKPRTLIQYLFRLSSIPYWVDRVVALGQIARADFSHLPYVPASQRARVTRSVRLQLALYAAIALGALAAGSWAPLTYWLIPGLIGQPVLRFYLLAEHTGCTEDNNGLTNTRTTLTTWPVRLLMWNLPFHAEHHLYPSIPFHALPATHALVRDRLAVVDRGYLRVHRGLIAGMMRR